MNIRPCTNLLWGPDEEETKRENNKVPRLARPDFSELQNQCNQRRQAKQKKREVKDKQSEQPQQQFKHERNRGPPCVDALQPPKFITIQQTNEEDVQQNLEEFVEEQFLLSHRRVTKYVPESDFGPTEYKLRLVGIDFNRLTHLTTQMNYRLQEGNGVAYYKIGVEDSGNPMGLGKPDMLESLRTLCTMAGSLKAEVVLDCMRQGVQGKVAEMTIRKGQKEGIKLDVRVLLLGETGSGKTSLLGVLSSGQQDDGKGFARMKILKNANEILSGKTERVSHTVIGLDNEGRIINHQAQISFLQEGAIEKVVDMSQKLITFIDMGGHKRAHNQMIKILNSSFPDYALLITSATAEMNTFTEDYFKLLHVHKLPIMVAITHLDIATELQVDQILQDIKRVVKELKDDRIPLILRSEEDAVNFSKQIFSNLVVPIFLISNVTGQNIPLIVKFMNLLPSNNEHINNSGMDTELFISNTYESNGIKILGGTVIKGTIKEKQILQIGPDKQGSFYPIEVEDVQCNRVKVKSAQCGQICTITFKRLHLSNDIGGKANPIRRGMVLVEGKSNPRAYREFQAEIWLFDDVKQSKQISYSFQPVINTQTARQICKLIPDINEVPTLPALEKKKSKSIDQKKSFEISKPQSLGVERKQSLDIKLNHESPTIKSRKKSYSGQEDKVDKGDTQIQLFVINENERLSKYETLTIEPGHGKLIRLRFMYYPEYIHKGMRVLINENQFRAVGWIKQLFY